MLVIQLNLLNRDELKLKMTSEIENKMDYESMDKTDFLDTYFFKGDGFSPKGQEFIEKVNEHKTNLTNMYKIIMV